MSGTMKELEKDFDTLMERFEKERRELVENAGEKMQIKVLQNIEKSTVRRSGNLLGGCELEIGSGDGYAAVRNNHRRAPHAHLVEYGHKVTRGTRKKIGKRGQEVSIKGTGRQIGWAEGKFMYRNAMNELEGELEQTARDMIEKMVGEIF